MIRGLTLSLILSIGFFAQAKDPVVAVKWRYTTAVPGGGSKTVVPPASYLQTLQACGIKLSGADLDVVPVSKLDCPGLLDFSEQGFKKMLHAFMQSLIDSGIQSIGATEIKSLREHIDSVRFGVSNYGLFESILDGPGTPRRMAVNIAGQKLIIVNRSMWRLFESSEFADLFLFHELLGALDQRDENYQVTLSAWWMRLHPDRIAPLSKRLSSLIKLSQKPIRVAGVSVVGHGGDTTQLLFKASLLAATLTQKMDTGNLKHPPMDEVEATIITAPVSSVPETFFKGREGLCVDVFGRYSPLACGGFTLKGATGKPFMLMNEQWGRYIDDRQRHPLVQKILHDVVKALICASGQVQCPRN